MLKSYYSPGFRVIPSRSKAASLSLHEIASESCPHVQKGHKLIGVLPKGHRDDVSGGLTQGEAEGEARSRRALFDYTRH